MFWCQRNEQAESFEAGGQTFSAPFSIHSEHPNGSSTRKNPSGAANRHSVSGPLHASRGAVQRSHCRPLRSFIRFLLHTLPPGFQLIRYFGLMANRHRK